MDITNLDIGAWLSVYFGIGLVNAGLPGSRVGKADFDPRGKLAFAGYGLLVFGALILMMGLFR